MLYVGAETYLEVWSHIVFKSFWRAVVFIGKLWYLIFGKSNQANQCDVASATSLFNDLKSFRFSSIVLHILLIKLVGDIQASQNSRTFSRIYFYPFFSTWLSANVSKKSHLPILGQFLKPSRVEVPEQISAEQRCFRDSINFSADQRCFRMGYENQRWSALFQSCSALVFSESALFSAGSKRIEKPTKMLRVSSIRYWDHEKHVLLECTSYEKIIPAKFQSKIRIDAPASSSCFLVVRDL